MNGKIHVLRDIACNLRNFHGVKFGHDYPNYMAARIEQGTAAVPWLDRRAYLYVSNVVPQSRRGAHYASGNISFGGKDAGEWEAKRDNRISRFGSRPSPENSDGARRSISLEKS